jgi:hypothetical protein
VAEKGAARVPPSRPGCEHCDSRKISLANQVFQVPMLYVVIVQNICKLTR